MTRNIYVNLSRKIGNHHGAILLALKLIFFGGFLSLSIASQVFANSKSILSIGGRLWFSTSAIFSALYMVTQWFNPERDKLYISSKESFLVMVINFIVFIAIYTWFMED